MVTIQFVATKLIASKAISFCTWSWASHVDFVLPDGQLLGALGFGGVCIHGPHKPEVITRVERYTVDAPEDAVLGFAKEQIGKPYDWAGIYNFISRERQWDETDKWFCSELVAYSFKQAGYPLLRVNSFRVTPGHILMSPLLIPQK